jgi:hypothetical protein
MHSHVGFLAICIGVATLALSDSLLLGGAIVVGGIVWSILGFIEEAMR